MNGGPAISVIGIVDTSSGDSSKIPHPDFKTMDTNQDDEQLHLQKRAPLYIFLLSGQSNMVGRGHVDIPPFVRHSGMKPPIHTEKNK
jgi:hypothetical protein